MDKKGEIYSFIRDEISVSGRPPTIREIGEKFNISSTNGVRYFLDKLESEGLIRRHSKTARGISLVSDDANGKGRSIPILGRVRAGGPDYCREYLEGYMLIDERFARGNDVFAVKVSGDSMLGAGIHDGDIALVKRNPDPASGEIVIALIDDEVTLKRFIRRGDNVILKPENREYEDIVLAGMKDRNISILGTLEAILRRY
jgi:repressor LexA